MNNSKLMNVLRWHDLSVSLDNVLQNAKAYSGGSNEVNFLRSLLANGQLKAGEAILKRSSTGISEEYLRMNYKKLSLESDRHFYCRSIIQEELKARGIETLVSVDLGDMSLLRENCCYDIVLSDFSAAIDIGLTPARNFYRGLTDMRVNHYLLTTYFDDYMDDIVFFVLSRGDERSFCEAVRSWQEKAEAVPIQDVPEIHDALLNRQG